MMPLNSEVWMHFNMEFTNHVFPKFFKLTPAEDSANTGSQSGRINCIYIISLEPRRENYVSPPSRSNSGMLGRGRGWYVR